MKRIVRLSILVALSLGLLGGPLAEVSSAKHRKNYPPEAPKCKTKITTLKKNKRRIVIRIKVVCKGLGVVYKEVRVIYRSEPLYVGTFTTDGTGSIDAEIPVPEGLKPGSHHLQIFEADSVKVPGTAPQVVTESQVVPATTLGSPLESIPLQVTSIDGKKTVLAGSNLSSAPASSTGSSSKAPLTAAAVGLVGIGATGLGVARRRRNATDAGGA